MNKTKFIEAQIIGILKMQEEGVKHHVQQLSKAEGNQLGFIIRNRQGKIWCVCTICFNPKVNHEIKASVLGNWEMAMQELDIGREPFSKIREKLSSSKQGELQINWQAEADEFDYLIAASSLPRNRTEEPLTAEELPSMHTSGTTLDAILSTELRPIG